jgi:acetylornithine deacetylase/succinyl-diaminopimelate desuccinylase-like protein
MTTTDYNRLDQWIDAHFDEQVSFLQSVLSVPTDTPPGNNTPHALHTAELLKKYDMQAQAHAVPDEIVRAAGLESITNLIVKRQYGQGGRVLALNAHGDVVPPGDGWTYPPYAGEVHDGKIYGRAAAVSKCDFSTYIFAVRALESLGVPLKGRIELQFTYDEEFGGELGPGWLLKNKLTQPDLAIAAGFSYQIITAHNGCLQLEVTVNGKMGHAAVPSSGVDALQAAVKIMNALYALNDTYKAITSKVPGINHPYLNIGLISGGTNTNVIPGKVVLKLDRRMIPEEDPAQVEQSIRLALPCRRVEFCWHAHSNLWPVAMPWWARYSSTQRLFLTKTCQPAARLCMRMPVCIAKPVCPLCCMALGHERLERAALSSQMSVWSLKTLDEQPKWLLELV